MISAHGTSWIDPESEVSSSCLAVVHADEEATGRRPHHAGLQARLLRRGGAAPGGSFSLVKEDDRGRDGQCDGGEKGAGASAEQDALKRTRWPEPN